MRINNNIMAMNAHRQLGTNQANGAKSMERLSSGLRINRAGDDAAGLAISEKMRGQIRGLKQAARNSQDAISLIQTAEGALNETHAILQRMRELATQSASDTNTEVDRGEIQKEIDELASEITRIADTTQFNTQNLLAGEFSGIFHIGANAEQNITLSINAMDAASLGVAGAAAQYVFTSEELGSLDFSATGDEVTVAIGEFSVTLDENYNDIDEIVDALNAEFADAGITVSAGVGDTLVFTGSEEFAVSTVDDDGDPVTELSGDAVLVEPQAVAASGTTEVDTDDVTITGGEGAAYNGITIEFVHDTNGDGISAAYDEGSNTITVTLSVGNDDDLVTTAAINAAIAGIGDDAPEGVEWSSITVSGIDDAKAQDWSAAADVVLAGGEDAAAGSGSGINVSTQEAADEAITVINNAIETVSAERSKLGAYQNRLEHTIANLGTSAENLQAAESRIRDLDMAEEIMAFTKNNILQQAATAMLAQANMAPQSVLQLLG